MCRVEGPTKPTANLGACVLTAGGRLHQGDGKQANVGVPGWYEGGGGGGAKVMITDSWSTTH